MKIRFKTKDGLTCVKECQDIDPPVSVVMSPLWSNEHLSDEKLKDFMEYRRYEFRGEIDDGIPTVHES